MTVPDFSSFAGDYARSRLRYPAALFAELAALVPGRELAWDCATGNGQAAVGLAEHFRRVMATDRSAEQIAHAPAHPRIEYRVAPAESSGLDGGSVDLVTVAAAVHWFDLDAFTAEVRRVVRPGGALAVWTYHVGHMDPPFDRLFDRFYRDVLRPYFGPRVAAVDALYGTLDLPGEPIPTGEHGTSADWSLDQLRAFIASWSGTRRYIEENGRDPVEAIAPELGEIWGPAETIRTLGWPLFLRARRL